MFKYVGIILAVCALAAGGRARAMTYTQDKVNGKTCEIVGWTDANGKKRSVALVRADGDVHNFKGGYIEQYKYFVGEKENAGVSWNQGQESVSGLGCAVNHGGGRGNKSASHPSTEFVLKGDNHCIWRFKGGCGGAKGKTVELTIDYSICEGHNDVLWTISYDCSALPAGDNKAEGGVNWDARGPYVQFDWDGNGNFYKDKISGIRWGDKYKFKTVKYVFDKPAENTWDYTEPNIIPYMMLWKDAGIGDLELGMVQTQPWEIQDAGGYWWSGGNGPQPQGAAAKKDQKIEPIHWGTTGTGMMENWNCPYQLNAYENYSGEKMAWGTNYGYVGTTNYDVLGFGRKASGYPHQGYAVAIVLNRHADNCVDKTIASMEAVQKTTLTATAGTVVAKGARHVNLEGDAEFKPAGWNHVHGTWAIIADATGAITANLKIAEGALLRPTFEIREYAVKTAPAAVTLNGTALTAGTDYAASVDEKNKTLYVTVLKDLTGEKNELAIK